MPKALKSCPKYKKLPNLVTLMMNRRSQVTVFTESFCGREIPSSLKRWCLVFGKGGFIGGFSQCFTNTIICNILDKHNRYKLVAPVNKILCKHDTILCKQHTIQCKHNTILCKHNTIQCKHNTMLCNTFKIFYNLVLSVNIIQKYARQIQYKSKAEINTILIQHFTMRYLLFEYFTIW